MRRSMRLLAALALVAFASLAIAAPAAGATLPAGQRITVMDPVTGDVYTADPATAALTLVATGTPWGLSRPTAIDVDDSGHGYLVSVVIQPNPGLIGESTLWNFDANTGQVSNPIPLQIDDPVTGPQTAFGCEGLDLRSDGVPVVTCYYFAGPDSFLIVGPVSPTGHVPASAPTSTFLTTTGPERLSAYAVNPVDNQPFFFQWHPTDPTFDVVFHYVNWPSVGLIAQVPLSAPVWAADFDSSGQLFVTTEGSGGEPVLATLDPLTGATTSVGDFTVAGTPFAPGEMPPLTVWGTAPTPPSGGGVSTGPALAPTGLNVQWPAGIAGVLVAGGIGALVADGWRLRRQEARRVATRHGT